MIKNAKIIKTHDGSDTLFVPHLNETYHSIHGSLQESKHVYIQNGLSYFSEQNNHINPIHILEIGFGTGLNAALALEFSIQHKINIHYETIEPFPLSWDLLKKFNFGIINQKILLFLENQHQSDAWSSAVQVDELFSFTKHKTSLEDFVSSNLFDVVFFDCFAPNKQPSVWSTENFQKLSNMIKNEGVLVTYCAQGEVRRRMMSSGFEVNRIPGPPKKREMIRAIKRNN